MPASTGRAATSGGQRHWRAGCGKTAWALARAARFQARMLSGATAVRELLRRALFSESEDQQQNRRDRKAESGKPGGQSRANPRSARVTSWPPGSDSHLGRSGPVVAATSVRRGSSDSPVRIKRRRPRLGTHPKQGRREINSTTVSSFKCRLMAVHQLYRRCRCGCRRPTIRLMQSCRRRAAYWLSDPSIPENPRAFLRAPHARVVVQV